MTTKPKAGSKDPVDNPEAAFIEGVKAAVTEDSELDFSSSLDEAEFVQLEFSDRTLVRGEKKTIAAIKTETEMDAYVKTCVSNATKGKNRP